MRKMKSSSTNDISGNKNTDRKYPDESMKQKGGMIPKKDIRASVGKVIMPGGSRVE